MENFTPVSALIGGGIIGAAAVMLLWLDGRIAGISGIAGGILASPRGDTLWRVAFVGGLAIGAGLWRLSGQPPQALQIAAAPALLAVAGLLVGIGTRLGSGCTSGHGVCGIARGSARSIAATVTFMATAIATVYAVRTLMGGTP